MHFRTWIIDVATCHLAGRKIRFDQIKRSYVAALQYGVRQIPPSRPEIDTAAAKLGQVGGQKGGAFVDTIG